MISTFDSKYTIKLYKTSYGESQIEEWLEKVPSVVSESVDARILRMKLGNFGDSRNLSGGIHEARIHSFGGIRLYYAIELKVVIVLLLVGNKASQKKDIIKARQYWFDYKLRN